MQNLESSSPYDLIVTQYGQFRSQPRQEEPSRLIVLSTAESSLSLGPADAFLATAAGPATPVAGVRQFSPRARRPMIEAHVILKEIKRLQLNEMDAFTADVDNGIAGISSGTLQYIHFPAVIVVGTNIAYEERKNQLTRLGALDYCGWGDEYGRDELSVFDLRFFGALYRALSRKQEVK